MWRALGYELYQPPSPSSQPDRNRNQSREPPRQVQIEGRSSEETILNQEVLVPRVDSETTKLVQAGIQMATVDEATNVERKRSHGIGGAGNMRLPSVVAAAQDAPAASKEEGTFS